MSPAIQFAMHDSVETVLPRVSRAALRTGMIAAILCVWAGLFAFAALKQGVAGVFAAILALMLGWNSFSHVKLERSILGNFGESLGTVLEYRRLGIKRGAVIVYEFLANDNRTHAGTDRGGLDMPAKGQKLLIIYNLNEPLLNLPLSSFWFYRFVPSHSTRAV
jgi:hypothetical protein